MLPDCAVSANAVCGNLDRRLQARNAVLRLAPRIVRIYTLRGFESVLAGSVQVSTGTKTSLSFQDGPVFTRVHRREGPAAPRGSRARTHGMTISQPTWPGVPDRLHPAHGAGAGPATFRDPRRIRRGLLKGEQLHALVRCVHYGRLGRLDQRDFERQTGAASCLLLILAAIIYWQIREIDRVLSEAGSDADDLNFELLSHISPIGWDNVLLYGEYQLNRSLVRSERLSV